MQIIEDFLKHNIIIICSVQFIYFFHLAGEFLCLLTSSLPIYQSLDDVNGNSSDEN